MAYRLVDKELYDKMVIAYREYGKNFRKVSRVVGAGIKTVRRGWEIGWPQRNFKPIKDCIFDDQVAARAAIQSAQETAISEREAMVDEARRHAIDARKQEGGMVRMVRGGAVNVLAQALKLLKASGPLSVEIETELLHEMSLPRDKRTLDIKSLIDLLERISRYTQSGAALADVAMRLERLHLGQPEQIVGVQVEDMSPEQAMLELKEAEAALRRFNGNEVIMLTESTDVS